MFPFVVKYMRALAGIPGAPQVFDGLLRLWYLAVGSRRVAYVDAIEEEAGEWEGVMLGIHRFGGTQFNLGRREIGHIHGNGLVDILTTKEIRDRLVRDGKAQPHHIFPHSNWISFRVRSELDVAAALALLRLSYDRLNERNRPA
jgi:hypothetical protein